METVLLIRRRSVTGTAASKVGKNCFQDERCSGRPSTSMNAETILKVRELVHANWWITIEGSSDRRTMVDTALFNVCSASAN